jgi:hypothetical protein
MNRLMQSEAAKTGAHETGNAAHGNRDLLKSEQKNRAT